MIKKLFPIILAGSVVFAQTVNEFRAVKLTNVDSQVLFSDKNIADAMDFLAAHNINVVLTVVWNSNGYDGDYTLFPSEVMNQYFGFKIGPIGSSVKDPLQRVITEAHRVGIEVIPWFEMGFSTSRGSEYSESPDHILQKYPEWASRTADGKIAWKNNFFWMSAINPDVQEFIRSLTLEVCNNYDIDGIEYSDRIPAMPIEAGYDSVTVALYQAEHAGTQPPTDYNNADWKVWRAGKLTEWFTDVRDSIKSRASWIELSSSPSVYPWGYDEYLQDSRRWVLQNIIDSFIPQLYRYDYSSYVAELDNSLYYTPAEKRDMFFAGILMNIGRDDNPNRYVISPEFLLKSLAANRARNVNGEAFFYYEGLRKNNNLLADTLLATYYQLPAINPYRKGIVWRPKAIIVNEDDAGAVTTGQWEKLTTTSYGFKPNILLKDASGYATIDYFFEVANSTWYDVFAYIVRSPTYSTTARYMVFNGNDSTFVFMNQNDAYATGWQKIGTVFLQQGKRRVLKLDNSGIPAGKKVIADAAMIMINRKLSSDVIVSVIRPEQTPSSKLPERFAVIQNYPNPFNSSTIISYELLEKSFVRVKLFDVQGNEIRMIFNGQSSIGKHEFRFEATGLAAGIYFIRLDAGDVPTNLTSYSIGKMVLLK